MVRHETLQQANASASKLRRNVPHAVSARFDVKRNRVIVSLISGVELAFPPQLAQGLEDATPSQLRTIEISPSGYGLHFPKIDADVYVPALLDGILGSRKWMAAQLGATGGRSSSPAKARAARSNGQLGGRPKKAVNRESRNA
jgi:hypothetical protein